jgi:L-ascorbate metabolism protein UlaG (beta-lactamase superfamily)
LYDEIRARAETLLRIIDEQRDADDMPPGHLVNAADLLQVIITQWVYYNQPDFLYSNLGLIEETVGVELGSESIRILGSGDAAYRGYEGPYKPGYREMAMMFMPPNALFDCGWDAERKMARWGFYPADIEHIFVTHAHYDHCDPESIVAIARQRVDAGLPPLTVHGSNEVCDWIEWQLRPEPELVFDRLEPDEETQAGELRIKALRATHHLSTGPLTYIIHWRGRTAYYGTDTAYPKGFAYSALAAETFDVFVHEMTMPASADNNGAHMDYGDIERLVRNLRLDGAILPWTRVVTMHQDPSGVQSLPDIFYYAWRTGFESGYDGMPVPLVFRWDQWPEQDCNGNRVPDDQDVASGTSPDCDQNGFPDECQSDNDGDEHIDPCDNCPATPNADQLDSDTDGTGDVCDEDDDGDGVLDEADNCPLDANSEQDDTDADGVGDSCDLCPDTLPEVSVDETGCAQQTPGDFDRDGDVDQTDFGRFQACLTGSGASQDAAECRVARLDDDLDVDQDDFGLFQSCISGPNKAANPDCLN